MIGSYAAVMGVIQIVNEFTLYETSIGAVVGGVAGSNGSPANFIEEISEEVEYSTLLATIQMKKIFPQGSGSGSAGNSVML